MNTSNNKPIFIQIKILIEDKILSGELMCEQQLPSVRELSSELDVNANTIVRTYERLSYENIINSVRGVGFFVNSDAKSRIRSQRLEEFRKTAMPEFIKQLRLLDVDIKEVINLYNNDKDEK